MCRRLTGLLIAAVFFCATAPTLGRLQFGDPIENLNVATAMEIRRGGAWLFPTLQGEPRLAKPPLTAWLTAAFLHRSTLAAVARRDLAVRSPALADLAFEARLPALLAMCLTLIVVYEMGRIVWAAIDVPFGNAAGWIAAVACGSTFIFQRECRVATTDAQLALWVALANLFLAKAVLQGRRWAGALGAGAALGLALMTKGPIALVQTAVPFAAFALWRRFRRDRDSGVAARDIATHDLATHDSATHDSATHDSATRGSATHDSATHGSATHDLATHGNSHSPLHLAPTIAGALLMLILGLPWYACAARHFNGTASLWMAEATRIGADGPPSGAPWYRYIGLSYLFSPWIIWMAAGVAAAFTWNHCQPSAWPTRLSLLLLVMPLFLMSFARDRYERYMTPMVPAAALLAAGVLSAYLRRRDNALEQPTDVPNGVAPNSGVMCAIGAMASCGGAMGKRTRLPVYDGPRPLKHGQASTLAHGTQTERIGTQTGSHGTQTACQHTAPVPGLSRLMHAHLLVTGAGVIGLSIAGASGLFPALRTAAGAAWFTPATAARLCAGGVGLLWISAIASRRWRGWPILATAALTLIGQAIYFDRLANSASSRSTLRPAADLIIERFPDAELYAYRPGGQNIISVPANDLSIHLNRAVTLVADMSRIARSNRPQLFVVYRSKGPKHVEMAAPRGWTLLVKPPAAGNEDRYLFARAAAAH